MKRLFPLIKTILLILAVLVFGFLSIPFMQVIGSGIVMFFSASDLLALTVLSYLLVILICVPGTLFLLLSKRHRPVLGIVTARLEGNRPKPLVIGLIAGLLMNGLAAGLAMLNGDFRLSIGQSGFGLLLLFFVCTLLQSSAEEVLCRGYIAHFLKEVSGSAWLAILLNPICFALGHFLNPGITPLALLNIYLIGVLFSLIVHYYRSLWMVCAAHAGWNFMQVFILGLPNSGQSFDFGILEFHGLREGRSFFYDPVFGLEGSWFCAVLFIVCSLTVIFINERKKRNAIIAEPLETDMV